MTDKELFCKALRENKDMLGFFANKNPKCPHCGSDYDISEHGAWQFYEEGEHSISCPTCDMDFDVSTRVSYSFSTDHQEDVCV